MIAVGERINGMFLDVKKAIKKQDAGSIADLARRQLAAGATYLDINVGTAAADQEATMRWLVETVQAAVDAPITLDSQKLPVLQAGLDAHDGKRPVMLNSCSADPDALDTYIPLAKKHDASLITLTKDKTGVPQDVDTRILHAATIVQKAVEHDYAIDKLFIDPIILPIRVDQKQPDFLLQVMQQVRLISDPPPHLMMGLSNLSQGGAERHLINRTFLVMAIAAGLDSAIVDVFDTELMNAAITAEMLMNHHIYSDSFLKAARA